MPLIKNHLTIGIVLFHNSREDVFRCLDAIANQEDLDWSIEVLIRDQGGASLQWVSEWEASHQATFFIAKNKGENLGFGEGHNSLFKQRNQSSIAYLCLNPDAQLHPLALAKLCAFAAKHEWHGLFEPMHEPVMLPKYYDPLSGLTEWSSGACLLIPVKVFEMLGGFDPNFFLYCEDVDFSWRARACGVDCYVCNYATVYHYVEDRSGREKIVHLSQCILAHKWGSAYDLERAKIVLTQGNPKQTLELQKKLTKILPVSSQWIQKVRPNFTQGDVYAKKLW